MAAVVVAGVVNVQQTIPVGGFPVHYTPVRYATSPLRLDVAGVGGNVARGLTKLGNEVRLATFLAEDDAGRLARDTLAREGLVGPGILGADATAQSAVLVDPAGRRHITTDLKDLPTARYPVELFRTLLTGADLASMSTIGFARDLLPVAADAGVPIAVDLQATSGLDDSYAADWIAHASIVFASAESLTVSPVEFAEQILARRKARVVVVGTGARGCLLATPGREPRTVAAWAPFGVTDTTGAGDALFTGFLHTWLRTGDPGQAIATAVLSAGWAVGFAGTGRYPTSADLDALASAPDR